MFCLLRFTFIVLGLSHPLYTIAEPAVTLPGEKDYGENCPIDTGDRCEGENCLTTPGKSTPQEIPTIQRQLPFYGTAVGQFGFVTNCHSTNRNFSFVILVEPDRNQIIQGDRRID